MRDDRAPKVYKFGDRIVASYIEPGSWLDNGAFATTDTSTMYEFLSERMHRAVVAIEGERHISTPTP